MMMMMMMMILLWVIDFSEVQFSSVLLLGMFAKLWKVTMSFAMPACPSIHMEQLGFHRMDFAFKFDITLFSKKSVKKCRILLKSDKNNGYFT